MSFEFKNPTSQIIITGPNSVPIDSNTGTNFSAFQVGGYLEVFSVNDLYFNIPSGETGTILYSGNTIPIDFAYNVSLNAPNVINLYSDGVSSGRRKLGMLVYVYETDTVYQLRIPDYQTLFDSAVSSGSLINIGTGFQCLSDTTEGADFIAAWTGNTVEGVSGSTRETSNWIKYNPEVFITGGTYSSGSTTLSLFDNTGGTISITGLTSGSNVENYGDGRLLVSDGTERGIEAKSELFFTGGVLTVSGSVVFDNSFTAATTVPGQLVWNQTDGTLDLTMKGGLVTQQIGQETYYPPVVNRTASILREGTLVMVNPSEVSHGNRLSVVKAVSTGIYPSILLVGVATEDIAINGEGYATWFGYVRNLKRTDLETYGIKPVGETWVVGNVLWANPNLDGGYTNVEPSAPNIKVPVAAITDINGQNITILVRPTLRPNLGDINNVQTSGATNGDLILFDSGAGIWRYSKTMVGDYIISGNTTIKTLTGATPTKIVGSDSSGRLNEINLTTTGTSGSATISNGNLNIPQYQGVISNPVTGTGVANQVTYWSGTNAITGSTGFTYNNSNGLFRIVNASNEATFRPTNDGVAISYDSGYGWAFNNTTIKNLWGNSVLIPHKVTVATTTYQETYGLSVGSTTGIKIPIGLTNERPVVVQGLIRFNTSINNFEFGANTTPSWIFYPKTSISGGTFSGGSIVFAGSDGLLTQNNSNLFWDNANNRLGVNLSTPLKALHVSGETRISNLTGSTATTLLGASLSGDLATVTLTTTGTSGSATISNGNLNIPQYQGVISNPVTGTGVANQVAYWSDTNGLTSNSNFTWTPNTLSISGTVFVSGSPAVISLGAPNNTGILTNDSNGTLAYTVNPNIKRFQINNTGKVLFGTGGTFSAALSVYSTGNTSTTTGLYVSNSNNNPSLVVLDNGNVGLGTNNPEYNFSVYSGSIEGLHVSANTKQLIFNKWTNGSWGYLGVTNLNTTHKVFDFTGITTSGNIEFNIGDYGSYPTTAKINMGSSTSHWRGYIGFSVVDQNNSYAVREVMRITDGNVGVGTNEPLKRLHVSGETRISNLTGSTAASLLGSSSSGDLATVTLTTTGTSGSAMISNGNLNIPQYQGVISNPVTGTGVANQVTYWSGTNAITGSTGLEYINTSSTVNSLRLYPESFSGGSSSTLEITDAFSIVNGYGLSTVINLANGLDANFGDTRVANFKYNNVTGVQINPQTGRIGVFVTPNYSIHINASDAIRIPVGSDASGVRPAAAQGLIRYNSTINNFEFGIGSTAAWSYYPRTSVSGGTFTSGSVIFAGSDGLLTETSNFKWDATNNRLTISGNTEYGSNPTGSTLIFRTLNAPVECVGGIGVEGANNMRYKATNQHVFISANRAGEFQVFGTRLTAFNEDFELYGYYSGGTVQQVMSFGWTTGRGSINYGLDVKGFSTGSSISLAVKNSASTNNFVVLDNGNVGVGTSSPSAEFEISGNTSGSTMLNIVGTSGQLFSVTDNLIGDIFSVNDISGVPVFTVNSSGLTKTNSASYSNQTATFNVFRILDTYCSAAWFDYYVLNTTNGGSRAGTIMAVWNASSNTVEFTDTSTADLTATTSGLTFSASISSTDLVLAANITSGNWTIRVGARVL